MTEYEVGEMLYNAYSLMTDGASVYFTLVSAYLVASYLVGDKLSSGQLVVVNLLYVIWSVGLINVQYTQLVSVAQFQSALDQFDSSVLVISMNTEYSTWGFIVVQITGLLASLYFMWSVRHPKIE